MLQTINVLGTGTPRYVAFHIHDEEIIDVPLGSVMVRWNLKTQQRIFTQPLFDSIISIHQPLHSFHNYFLIASYSGVLQIFSTDLQTNKYEPVGCALQLPFSKCMYASVYRNFIICCCEGNDAETGHLCVVKIHQQTDKIELELLGFLQCNSQYAYCIDYNTEKESVGICSIEQKRYQKNMGVVLKVYSFYDHTFEEVQSTIINESGPLVSFLFLDNASQNNLLPTRALLALHDKSILMLQANQDLPHQVSIADFYLPSEIQYTIKHAFLNYQTEHMIIAHDNGKLAIWDTRKHSMEKFIKIPSGPVYFVQFVTSKKDGKRTLYLVNESAIFLLKESPQHDTFVVESSIEYHKLTCCGITITRDCEYIISGDFSGNIMIWDGKHSQQGYKPLASICISMPIRSLCVRDSLESNKQDIMVNIGCLDGFIYEMKVPHRDDSSGEEFASKIQESLKHIITLSSDAIAMAWENALPDKPTPDLLACATSDGKLVLLQQRVYEPQIYRIQLAITAHSPLPFMDDDRFGSLKHFAEVWNLCFSPDNQSIMTCSEDQSSIIWNLKGQKLFHLPGHSLPVTCCKWICFSKEEYILTCGDDQTICVWKNNERNSNTKQKWAFYCLFSTKDQGIDWHTLTYMDSMDHYVVCCTQNGYILLFDLLTRKMVAKHKVHNGSIEGCFWRTVESQEKKNCLVTCSSDCSINVFTFKEI